MESDVVDFALTHQDYCWCHILLSRLKLFRSALSLCYTLELMVPSALLMVGRYLEIQLAISGQILGKNSPPKEW